MEFLNSLPPGAQFPCLILVDINMPQANGMETLKMLKGHPVYKRLPVIIFSTADSYLLIEMARQLGANDYVKKPVNFEKLRQVTMQFVDHCEVVPPVKE